jgi:hypothetical protein
VNPDDLAFYQDLCPALKSDDWRWNDRQSFLAPKAFCFLGEIQFDGVKGRRSLDMKMRYHNNGTRSWYSVSISKRYSDVYTTDLTADAYSIGFDDLKLAAIARCTKLLEDNLESILAKERELIASVKAFH